MPGDRERLAATFDSAAGHHRQARPGYPGEWYDELMRLARLRPGDRLVEVGCGTGIAVSRSG